MKNLRLIALLLTTTAALSACNSGTDTGDTNVESAQHKEGPTAEKDGNPAGDSATSGLRRAPDSQVSGREQFEKASETIDRNHDGLAD
ncbi:hypothetical protein [uncultured Hymenobacter sp.]|uniref:hypothetical protein n=1 Tax=uncultured Hymenobacter sp. TaxID=170016 RepID=UPI0035CC223F